MTLRSRFINWLVRGSSLHPRDPALADWLGGGAATSSGVAVTSRNMLAASAVSACVRNIAETVSTMPCELQRIERDADGRKRREEAIQHPLYWVLLEHPNEWQTAVNYWEGVTRHVQMRGNHYSIIHRNGAGQVISLQPLSPDSVYPFWSPAGKPAYRVVLPAGTEVTLLAGEIFHVRGPTVEDGLIGLSPVAVHRHTIGMALAARDYGASLFRNDGRPVGLLESDEVLDDDVVKRLKESWRENQTAENRHKIAVLEQGLRFKAISLSQEDAQYIQTRGFTDLEIARLFRVPPVKIGILERATYRNVEEQQRAWVADTLLGMARRIESAISRDLLIPAGRRRFRAVFNFAELLRGDVKTQAEVHSKRIQWGVYSPNDAREDLGLNPRPGGDDYLTPKNMGAGDDDDEPDKEPDGDDNDGQEKDEDSGGD